MANFNKSFNKLVQIEGWHADHAADSGGTTYFGIAKNYWPQYYERWGGPPNKEQASEFYRNEFWNHLGLDAIHDQRVADEILEQSVHMGHGRAGRFTQLAVNKVMQSRWLVVDGVIGPKTRRALNRLKWQDTIRWLKLMNVFQGTYYLFRTNQLTSLIEQFRSMPDDTQKVFFRGWLTRIDVDAT